MVLAAPAFDLDATLEAGQTFAWERRSDGTWQGFAGGEACILRAHPEGVEVRLGPVDAVRDYFHLNASWNEWMALLPPDPAVRRAVGACGGLRLIRDPWWPCTASFICSSLKQIPHIRQIHWRLRRAFAPPGAVFPQLPFPTPEQVAAAPESLLRRLGLGFRARHLRAAAACLAEDRFVFDALRELPTPQAAHALTQLPGVGDKIAHCILLYAGGRLDAFPLDVWMIRILRHHYRRPGRRLNHPADLHRFAGRHLGPARGLAQLFLFHHGRTSGAAHPLPPGT
jgi:N-glycosylase/DNA lyase